MPESVVNRIRIVVANLFMKGLSVMIDVAKVLYEPKLNKMNEMKRTREARKERER